MDVFAPPTFKFFQLLSALVYFMLLFHLPYIGTVMVSSIFSVIYGRHKPELAKDFGNLVLGKIGTWLAFGLLPTLALAVLYKLLFYNTEVPIGDYILRIMALQIGGIVLLFIYRKTSNIILGAGGVLLVMGYCFHLINLMAYLLFPEKWQFEVLPVPFPLFAITPLIHFKAFLFLSLIMTGAAILVIYYRWTERKLSEDTPHFNLLKQHAYGLIIAGAALLPAMILWDLYTLPRYALSIPVFVLSGLCILVICLVLGAAASMVRNHKEVKPRHSVTAAVLTIILLCLMVGKDRMLQANANLETHGAYQIDALKAQNAILSAREELYAKNMVISAAEGETIYNEVCTACHAFDKVVLGPAHDATLPKYLDNPDDLVEFLKNPSRVDTAFPAMPNPGLTTHKIKSVVKFLMGRMGKEWPAGSGDNAEGDKAEADKSGSDKKAEEKKEETGDTGAAATEPGSTDENKTETTETNTTEEKKDDSGTENKDNTAADESKADSQVK